MSAPVKHTCPDIDKAIRLINSAMKIAMNGQKQSDYKGDDWDRYRDIVWELDGIESTLEDLRKSNDELRKWGLELEKQVEEMEIASQEV